MQPSHFNTLEAFAFKCFESAFRCTYRRKFDKDKMHSKVKNMWWTEAVTQRCSIKNMFLKISQNLLENTCARVSFLIKLQAAPETLFKKEFLAQLFYSEFCEFFKDSYFEKYLQTTSGWNLFLIS